MTLSLPFEDRPGAQVPVPATLREAALGFAWQAAVGAGMALGGFVAWSALARAFPRESQRAKAVRANPTRRRRRR